MSIAVSSSTPRARPIQAIGLGGLAVGILDFFDAITFFGLHNHLTPIRIFQSVASGWMGRDAFNHGWKTFALGLFFHFVVAFLIATVYYIGTLVLPVLLKYPVACGLLYGIVAYFVMTFVVVPLSKIGPRPFPPLAIFLNGIIGHALLVGLPVALIASWSARRR